MTNAPSVLDQVQALLEQEPVIPTVEAQRRSPIPSPTSVPTELEDWAAAHDLCLSWQTHTAEHLSQIHVRAIRPLLLKDEVEEEALEKIPEHLLFMTPEGYAQSGNAVLCVQPRAEREAHKAHVAAMTNRMEGAAGDEAALAREAQAIGVDLITPEYAESSRPQSILGGRVR